jgi:hypothetical protein
MRYEGFMNTLIQDLQRQKNEIEAAIAKEVGRVANHTTEMHLAEALYELSRKDYDDWSYEKDWNGPGHQRLLSRAKVIVEKAKIMGVNTNDPDFVINIIGLYNTIRS